ncbi:hypothetical protein CGCVW01_v010206, partial [Colletotrichum viniferum]
SARGSFSEPQEVAAAKRKLDPADAGNLDGIQKRRRGAESRAVGHAWTGQYYQGINSSKFSGSGCGLYAFGTLRVLFQAPFTCDGRLEISSGLGGPRSGSIRLCGPKDYWGLSKDPRFELDAIFMLPFKHVGESMLYLFCVYIAVVTRSVF